MSYNIKYKDDHLAHAGKKGMKWGFNDGQRNGRRTSEEILDDLRDGAENVMDGDFGDYVNEVKRGVTKLGKKASQKVDETRYSYRLNRYGLADRYGSTLIKYGLNKIGDDRLDNKLSSAHRKAKRKVKQISNKIKRTIKDNGGIVSTNSRISVGDEVYERKGRNGKYKRVK